MLTDAGPLVAMVDRRDPHHRRCVRAAGVAGGRLRTTWPCFTEAMYLVGRTSGFRGQSALWRLVGAGHLAFHQPTPAEPAAMAGLMARYHDLPMDLADASLVAAADALRGSRIFTLDADFLVYRRHDGSAFDLTP